jgi:aspartate/methionine/tyrosine aminotransferase
MSVTSIRRAVLDLPRFPIVAIAEYGRAVGGVTPLWFGESDRNTPDFITEAAIAALRGGHTFYQSSRGDPELRATIADYMTGLYGAAVTEDRINITPSGISAIAVALQAVVEPGRNVVMVTPVWPNAGRYVTLLGAALREVALDRRDTGWTLDLDQLNDAIDDKTSALFLNSPNNPTGWMADDTTMAAVVALCRRRGIWLISDEVYTRLVYDRPVAPSALHYAEPDDRVLIINSFSKNWSMTGWRLGWLTSPPGCAGEMEKLCETQTGGAASFIQRAGITAIREGEAYLSGLIEDFRVSRDLVSQHLAACPGVNYAAPHAGFYAFFSVEGESDGLALARRLIDESRLGLAPGVAFGAGAEAYVRLCFASSRTVLSGALERLSTVLAG